MSTKNSKNAFTCQIPWPAIQLLNAFQHYENFRHFDETKV